MAACSDTSVKCDHVIIWLDKNMGIKENNKPSKKILDNNACLHRPLENEYSSEIDKLICSVDSELNEEKFENLIKSPLRMFTDETECIKCINDNIEAKKKVFLITSGKMSELIVPEVYNRLSGSIYIFCANRAKYEELMEPYRKHIEIYDDEKGVFIKVLSDIGSYYLEKCQNEAFNQTVINQYFFWARRLFRSATKLDNTDRTAYLEYTLRELAERNIIIADENENENNVQMVEADDDG